MAERIAQLYVELSARTDKLEAELKKSQTSLNRFKGGLKDVVEGLTGVDVATLGTVAAVGALAGGIKYAVTQAIEAEQAMAATEAAIKATGGAAGLTAEQVADMAGDLSVTTGIADDVVQSGQNMLLTFKQIKGEANFDRVTQAVADMAVAMNKGSLEGLDLQSTAIQVGKALNVVEGDTAGASRALSALTRVGVTFSQAQKDAAIEAIKLGDVLAYQGIVLQELESEFGGAAEAAGETTAGAIAKLKNAFSELAEEAGGAALPAISKVTGGLTTQFRAIGAVHEAFQDGIITQSEWANTLAKLGLVGVFVADDVLADIEKKTDAAAQAAADAADNTQDYAIRLGMLETPTRKIVDTTGDAAIAYQRMGEAANAGMGEAVEAINEAKAATDALANAALQVAVDAGLSGTITEEWDAYRQTIDDTTTSIAALDTGSEDYTTTLQGLEQAQIDARLAVEEATRQFLFQQLAVEGDALANLNLARGLGILDEASYNAALAAAELKTAYEEGKFSAEQFGVSADGLADAIARLQDKQIEITVTTIFHEIHQQTIMEATQAAGGQGGGVSEGVYAPHATGGMTWGGQAYLVGEHGPEIMVAPETGYMLNASRTVEVMGGGGGGDTFYIDARGSTMTPAQYEAITRRALAESGRQADNYRRTGRR